MGQCRTHVFVCRAVKAGLGNDVRINTKHLVASPGGKGPKTPTDAH